LVIVKVQKSTIQFVIKSGIYKVVTSGSVALRNQPHTDSG